MEESRVGASLTKKTFSSPKLEEPKIEMYEKDLSQIPVEAVHGVQGREKISLPSYRSVLKKVFFIDLERCIGCKSCEVACAREHHGKPLLSIQTVEEHTVPLHCQHCETNLCIEVCPKEAIEKNGLGIAIINEMKCIGCGACITACPFGIIRLDEERKVVTKCDLCCSRLEKDLPPICVLTCPAEAVRFISCIGCNICAVACPFAKP